MVSKKKKKQMRRGNEIEDATEEHWPDFFPLNKAALPL